MELQRPPAVTHRKHRKKKGGGDVQSAEERKRKNMAQKKFKRSSWKISDPATTSPHDISERKCDTLELPRPGPNPIQRFSDIYLLNYVKPSLTVRFDLQTYVHLRDLH